MSIPKETRRESYMEILPKAKVRREVIVGILKENGRMSAQEVAQELFRQGITPTDERNFAAPRITELRDDGVVEAVGKKVCYKTGKKVTVWEVK